MNHKCTLIVLVLLGWVVRASAQDTFSIVAVDTVMGEIGSAGASCINSCIIISDPHPGIGVIHTQALWNPDNQGYGLELMEDSLSAQQIIDSLVAHDAQDTSSIRQYGVVTLRGPNRAAAFTGTNCMNYKGHIVGPTYSIQGNILIGREVLEDMEARFLSTTGSLADRLMAALQGAKRPGADTRCLADGTSSKSSFLRLASADDLYLDIVVYSVKPGVEPIDSLQNDYNKWKQTKDVKQSASEPKDVKVVTAPDRVLFQFGSVTTRRVEISDAAGRAVFHASRHAAEIAVDRNFLGSGVYFYRVSESETHSIATGKFIIK